jgi:hypothetical protein
MIIRMKALLCIFMFALYLIFALPDKASASIAIGSLDADKTVSVSTSTSGNGTTKMQIATKKAGSYSTADLEGTWYLNGLAASNGIYDNGWVRGTFVIDSSGNFSANMNYSDSTSDTINSAMSITTDGIITMTGSPYLHCAMDSDKTVVACNDWWAYPTSASLSVLTKKAGSYSTADLSGTWYSNQLGSRGPWWKRGTVSFTPGGNGAFTYHCIATSSDPCESDFSGTMSLSADGVMTINGNPDPFQCHMDSGKTVGACTETWLDDGTTLISVFTKKADSYSADDLLGTWYMHSLASGPSAPYWERDTITIATGGAVTGTCTWSAAGSCTIPAGVLISITSNGVVTIGPSLLLTANAAGNGSGTVSSSSGGISYTYPALNTGSANIFEGTAVTLTAAAATGSTVGWTGDCSSTSGNATSSATCIIDTMNAPKTGTATFTKLPVRIEGTASYYTAIQLAYNAATTDQTVQMHAVTFTEDLLLANPAAVKLKGGYDTNFTSNPDFTTVHGTMTITGGAVTLENVIVL